MSTSMTPVPTTGTTVVFVGLFVICMLVVGMLGFLTYSRRHSRARTAVGADGPGWRTYGARLTATQAADLASVLGVAVAP